MHHHAMTAVWVSLATCLVGTGCSSSTNQVMVTPGPQQVALQRPAVVRQPAPKSAESGKKQLMGSAVSINPDCSAAGEPVVTIVKPPTNGRMTAEKGETYPSFVKENPRSACNSKKVPATNIYYTSNPGFTGTEYATVEVLFPQGNIDRGDLIITVR